MALNSYKDLTQKGTSGIKRVGELETAEHTQVYTHGMTDETSQNFSPVRPRPALGQLPHAARVRGVQLCFLPVFIVCQAHCCGFLLFMPNV